MFIKNNYTSAQAHYKNENFMEKNLNFINNLAFM